MDYDAPIEVWSVEENYSNGNVTPTKSLWFTGWANVMNNKANRDYVAARIQTEQVLTFKTRYQGFDEVNTSCLIKYEGAFYTIDSKIESYGMPRRTEYTIVAYLRPTA